MAGVAIVARSGGHYEASGELQPGKLKNVLGLAFLASFCFALSLASGARRRSGHRAGRQRCGAGNPATVAKGAGQATVGVAKGTATVAKKTGKGVWCIVTLGYGC